MEKTATNILAAIAAMAIVVATWAPVITIPPAQAAAFVAPTLA